MLDKLVAPSPQFEKGMDNMSAIIIVFDWNELFFVVYYLFLESYFG
jgi:hypothetical protein